jgi:fatty-acyl-CoA synthase
MHPAAQIGRMGAQSTLGFGARVKREIRFLSALSRTMKRIKGIEPDSRNLICDDLEAAVDKYPQRTAIQFEGKSWTYAQLDAMANRFAHWAKGRGIQRGDTVALFMPNRMEYIAAWYGFSKVGVATALINSNLTGPALAHSLRISGAAHLVADAETSVEFEAVRGDIGRSMMEWIVGGAAARADRDLDRTLKGVSSLRPTRETARYGVTAKDTALYIYTSGTTGLPKAARIPHTRAQAYMRGFAGATGAGPDDRIYVALPLYHATGGLCAVGAALLNGGAVVLKKKFSASQFWDDLSTNRCTMFVYIGELCRYLVNQPEHDAERVKVKLAFGNGLRPDVWERMLGRFQIGKVLEFYGSTEGNVSLFNFDGKVGAIGRIPKYLAKRFNVRLVSFDVETETPIRSAQGFCIPSQVGEAGEALGEIKSDDVRSNFTGYADKAATEKKIARDVFTLGDAWFRTGDLLKQDAEGYFYFVDRIGDTFRWKGENVSTSEVQERLSEAPGVKEANVYGVEVPGADGRAGMAGIVGGEGFELAALAAHVNASLPTYARPVFLRLQPEIETTGTFKYRKSDLVEQGFDPGKVGGDPLYVRDGDNGYAPLTPDVHARILAGEMRL